MSYLLGIYKAYEYLNKMLYNVHEVIFINIFSKLNKLTNLTENNKTLVSYMQITICI